MRRSVQRFFAMLATFALASASIALPVAAEAQKTTATVALSVDADASVAESRIPPRYAGRLEVAIGAHLVLASVALGFVGAFLHGPPLLCGLFEEDPASSDSCTPQYDGGPAFAASALAGVAGITLLAVGGYTIHRRNAALRALERREAYVRPIVIHEAGNAGVFLAGGLRF